MIVSDEGAGIRPQADSERDSLRLGLSLIAALSSSFSISGGIDRGTEITMRVPLQGGGMNGSGDPVEMKPYPADRTEMVIDRSELLGAGAWPGWSGRLPLAATSQSIGSPMSSWSPTRSPLRRPRASPTDACGWASTSATGGSTCGSDRWTRARRPRIREELEVPDVGGSLETLADELTVEESDDGEYLVIRFAAAP